MHQQLLILLIAVLVPASGIAENSGRGDVSVVERYSALMQAQKGHPRILLNELKLASIRSALKRSKDNWTWKLVQDSADFQLKEINTKSGLAGENLLWNVSELPNLLLAYLVTNEGRYLEASLTVLDKLCSMDDWFGNNDKKAAAALFVVTLGYDWLYHELDEKRRETYRYAIILHANIFFEVMRQDSKAWASNYLGNHNYSNSMALGIAGFALLNEYPGAELWLMEAQENLLIVLSYLSPDGASHEGVAYWSTGVNELLTFALTVAPIYGLDHLRDSEYLRNAAKFRLHASLPGFKENVDYADSPRWDYQGPQHLLHALAVIFNDPYAQWLADEITRNREEIRGNNWLDLIWANEKIDSKPPRQEETSAYFENLGLFFTRTSWDADASWAFFKAGPPFGWDAHEKKYNGGGHMHPDQGQFLYYSKGQWVVVDDGYVLRKRTANHNVIAIDGHEQVGGGGKWYKKTNINYAFPPRIIKHKKQAQFEYLVADLEGAYGDMAAIEEFRRTFVFFRDGSLVIHDNLSTNTNIDLESRIHTSTDFDEIDHNLFCFGRDGRGRLRIISPGGSKVLKFKTNIKSEERTPATRESMNVVAVEQFETSDFTSTFVVYEGENNCKISSEDEVVLFEGGLKLRTRNIEKVINFDKVEILVNIR